MYTLIFDHCLKGANASCCLLAACLLPAGCSLAACLLAAACHGDDVTIPACDLSTGLVPSENTGFTGIHRKSKHDSSFNLHICQRLSQLSQTITGYYIKDAR